MDVMDVSKGWHTYYVLSPDEDQGIGSSCEKYKDRQILKKLKQGY